MDHVAVGQQHGALDGVLQLPHVPRPVVGHEEIDGRGGEADDRAPVPLVVFLDEVVREEDDVGPAVAQRRHVDRKDI